MPGESCISLRVISRDWYSKAAWETECFEADWSWEGSGMEMRKKRFWHGFGV